MKIIDGRVLAENLRKILLMRLSNILDLPV